MALKDTDGDINLVPLNRGEIDARRQALLSKGGVIKPRIVGTKTATALNFNLDISQDRQYVIPLSERDTEQRSDALGQAQVGIGIKQYKGQRNNSAWIALASLRDTSNNCCT